MENVNDCKIKVTNYASPASVRLRRGLLRDFQMKIEHYQNLPMEAALSPITAQELISLMNDLFALFVAFEYSV